MAAAGLAEKIHSSHFQKSFQYNFRAGYATLLLAFVVSSTLLLPVLISHPRSPTYLSYENDNLYYSLSAFKRALSYSGAYAASSATDGQYFAKDAQAVRAAVVAQWSAALLQANSASGQYEFEISCGEGGILQCVENLAYLPSSDGAGRVLVCGDVRVGVKSRISQRIADGILPDGFVLGALP